MSIVWSYGVTTVNKPDRRNELLPATLQSLRRTGFDTPRLFVDFCSLREGIEYEDKFQLEVTPRNSGIQTYGNWLLALWELYVRSPLAHFYAIFQDDFECVLSLREYLEANPCPDGGYMNLYTFPSNQHHCNGNLGWFPSNQLGRGAVALVFKRENLEMLMTHWHMFRKPAAARKPTKSVDGAVSEAMKNSGQIEYVHNPSLVQHTGVISSMGNRQHPLSETYPGNRFDSMTWYREHKHATQTSR